MDGGRGGLPFKKGSGGIRNANTQRSRVLTISFSRPSLKEISPRHPPRVFPLGLRAPRLLCVLLFLAIAPVRWRGEGRTLFGGRKESFPQLRSPPRSGLLEYSVLYRFPLNVKLYGFVSVPSESALAQPPSSFSYPSLSLLESF
jgi:hypothetical protein